MMENATGSYLSILMGIQGHTVKLTTHTPNKQSRKKHNKANRADAFDDVENWICALQSNKNRNECNNNNNNEKNE